MTMTTQIAQLALIKGVSAPGHNPAISKNMFINVKAELTDSHIAIPGKTKAGIEVTIRIPWQNVLFCTTVEQPTPPKAKPSKPTE
jgi:hypothetical protein